MKFVRFSSVAVLFLLVLLTIPVTQSAVFGGDGTQSVRQSLQRLIPGTNILSIQPAPLEGVWEAIINDRGKKTVIYVDPKREYIIAGSIIHIASRTDLTKRKMDELNRIDISTIPLDDAIVLGNPEAKHKVIVFNDPD
jgi:thiol:disulfide interchange protein DsbC